MKQILFFLLSFGWGVVQGQTTTPADTTKPRDKVNTPVNTENMIPRNTPKAPNSVAFERYGTYPVNLYTGLPTIEIPLLEFAVDDYKVPIKLTYHASGNKVADQASWVGLGWTLHTGGKVSRTVLGLPDENAGANTGALLGRSLSPVAGVNIQTCLTPQSTSDLLFKGIAMGMDDAQRDEFMYQLPSGSNSFIMSYTAGAVFLSPEVTRIQSTSTLSSFTLVNNGGTLFEFNDTETATNNAPAYLSGWFLNRITGRNPSQQAVYAYTNMTASTSFDLTYVRTTIDQVFGTGGPGVNDGSTVVPRNNNASSSQIVPTQIDFPGGRIKFILEARADETPGSRLQAVEIYGLSVGGAYSLIKKYKFGYVNKARTGTGSTQFLDKLQLVNTEGVTIGQYSFDYNATALPEQASKAKDFWGYYNGQTGNTHLLPTVVIPGWQPAISDTPMSRTIPGANREPNVATMKAWVLEKITYPTGGYSTFDFEPHQYLDQSNARAIAGGLRIRQLKNYLPDGTTASVKTYKYGTNEAGAGTARFGRNFSQSFKNDYYVTSVNFESKDISVNTGPEFGYRQRTYSSTQSNPLFAAEGSAVTYGRVTEYEDSGTGGIGKTVYDYDDTAFDNNLDINGRQYVENRSWKRGHLLGKTVYGADGRKKQREEHVYTTVKEGKASEVTSVLIAFALQQLDLDAYVVGGNQHCTRYSPYPPTTINGTPFSFTYSFGLMLPGISRYYQYDDANDSRYILRTTQTDYSPRHYQPTETRTVVEGSSIVGTRYSYPQDFTYTIPATAEFQLIGIKTLQEQNVHQSVETISFKQETNDIRRYKTGQLTTFTAVTVNGKPIALPYHIYSTETDFNNKVTQTGSSTGPYAPSAESYNANSNTAVTPQPNVFPIDYVWQNPRLTMTAYDQQGTLMSYSLTAGSTTAYTYTTLTPPGGVLFRYPITETKNVGQPSVQATLFGYSIPLLGVSRITQPNGVYATYEYDTFGRLVRIRDQQGNILKQFTYRYATSTEAVP